MHAMPKETFSFLSLVSVNEISINRATFPKLALLVLQLETAQVISQQRTTCQSAGIPKCNCEVASGDSPFHKFSTNCKELGGGGGQSHFTLALQKQHERFVLLLQEPQAKWNKIQHLPRAPWHARKGKKHDLFPLNSHRGWKEKKKRWYKSLSPFPSSGAATLVLETQPMQSLASQFKGSHV